jgi:transcriptional regulator with XRE-family HTH domain
MKKRNIVLLPQVMGTMALLGEHIKLARLRRKLTAEQVAERAGISRRTLVSVEKGLPSVAMGIYMQVLFVLGLSDDMAKVASDDKLGRKLQDIKLMGTKLK